MKRRTFLKSLSATMVAAATSGLPAFASLPKMKITRVRAYLPPKSKSTLQSERHGRHHRDRRRNHGRRRRRIEGPAVTVRRTINRP